MLHGEARRTAGQCDRYQCRQSLGDRGDGEADRNEQDLERLFAAKQAGQEQNAADKQDDIREIFAKAGHSLLQRRRGLILLQQSGDAADLGRHAGRRDDAHRSAVCGQCRLERHIYLVAERRVCLYYRAVVLIDGHRFARQCRFVDSKRRRFKQPDVGGDDVSGLEGHHVAGHEFGGRDDLMPSVPDHDGLGDRHFLERAERLFGTILLSEADDGVQHDDDEYDRRVGQVAHHTRNYGRRRQYHDHQIAKLAQKQHPRRGWRHFGKFVRAKLRSSFGGFGRGEAVGRRGKFRQDVSKGFAICVRFKHRSNVLKRKNCATPVYRLFMRNSCADRHNLIAPARGPRHV